MESEKEKGEREEERESEKEEGLKKSKESDIYSCTFSFYLDIQTARLRVNKI